MKEAQTVSATFNVDLTPDTTITLEQPTGGNALGCAGLLGQSTVDGDTVSCSALSNLADGTYVATVTAGDAAAPTAARVTSTFSFTVDAQAPVGPDPSISPKLISRTSQTAVLVSGMTEGGATVTVTIDDQLSGEDVADASGHYEVAFDVTDLPDGRVRATVTATDAAGNQAIASDDAIKDTLSPSLVTSSPGNQSFVKVSPTTLSATFSEALAPTATMVLKDEAGTTLVLGEPTVDGSTVSADPIALSDGAYTVDVGVSDVAGNGGAGGFSFTLDRAAPAAPGLQVPPVFNGGLPVSGTGEPHAVVTVNVTTAGPLPAPVASATATVSMDGTYTAMVPVPELAPDGDYAVSASQTDRAGNTSLTAGPVTSTKDSTVPTTPVVNVSPDPIGKATQNAVVVSGTADAGDLVELVVTDGSTTVPAGPIAVGTDGSYRFEGVDVEPLADGTLTFSVTATDAAGNPATGSKTAVKDVLAPVVGSLDILDDPVTAANQTQVDVSGVTQPGSRVTVVLTDEAGASATRTATAGVDSGIFEVRFDATALADGTLAATASAVDPAGNEGPVSAPDTAQKDATPPDVPTQEQGDVSIANVASYVVTGMTSPSATATVTIDDADNPLTTSVQAMASLDSAGRYTTDPLDVSGLRDGVLTVVVTATDAVGNESVSRESRTKDTAVPGEPTVAIEENPVTADAEGGVLATISATSPAVTGSRALGTRCSSTSPTGRRLSRAAPIPR